MFGELIAGVVTVTFIITGTSREALVLGLTLCLALDVGSSLKSLFLNGETEAQGVSVACLGGVSMEAKTCLAP